MRYSKATNTVYMMGKRRVRSTSIGMLLLVISMLLFLTLFIHLDKEDNIILYALTYSAYSVVFIGNLYLLVDTESKLFIAPLWVGLSFLIFSITLFVAFAFQLWGSSAMKVFLTTAVYFAVLIVIGCILKAIRFHSFKNGSKVGSSVFTGIFGVGVGRALYVFVKETYGETAVNAMIPSLLFLLSVIFGIAGILYINQYFLIRGRGFRKNIRFDD